MRSKFFDKETHYHLGRPDHCASVKTLLAQHFDADKICLEIGAGNGRGTKILADYFAKVIAVEPVAELAVLGQGVFALDNVELQTIPIEEMSELEFDYLICFQATHWFYRSAQYQKLYARAQKPVLDIKSFAVTLDDRDFIIDLFETYQAKDIFLGVDFPKQLIFEDSYEADFSVEQVAHAICSTSWIDHNNFEEIFDAIQQRYSGNDILERVTTLVYEVDGIDKLDSNNWQRKNKYQS